MRSLAICFALVAILSSSGFCGIDGEFKVKLNSALPNVDMSAWLRIARVPHRYSYRYALDNVPQMDILNKGGEVLGVTLTNGQAAPLGPGVIAFHPYKDCASLAFATSIEGLQFDKVINAQDGLVKMNAHYGQSNGGLATVRSTFAYTYLLINQQFNEQNVQVCKKILFIKKCHNEVHRHPRGLTHDEVTLVTQGAIWMTLEAAIIAFNGHNLQTPQIAEQSEGTTKTISSLKKIRGVAHHNIGNAIDASIGTGFVESNGALFEENVQFNEFTTNFENASGKHKVTVSQQGDGDFDITILTN